MNSRGRTLVIKITLAPKGEPTIETNCDPVQLTGILEGVLRRVHVELWKWQTQQGKVLTPR